MKSILFYLSTLSLFLAPLLAQAQFKVVEYDYSNAYFNNGQDLPSGSKMILNGKMPVYADRIEVAVYKANANKEKKPLHLAAWTREANDTGLSFRMPLPYELRSNSSYDFRFTFYRLLTEEQAVQLKENLYHGLDTYINQTIAAKGTKMKVMSSSQRAISDMNTIVSEGLRYYQTTHISDFEGFSDLVRGAFENVKRNKLDSDAYVNAEFQQQRDSSSAETLRTDMYTSYVTELKSIAHQEIDNYLQAPQMIQTDVRDIIDYSTDKASGALALNIGYGGVLLEGTSLDDLSYATAPYVGISLPLAKRSYAPAILANTSLSVGVFTKNFIGADSSQVSGPIFGRPYFVGIGYNIFRFIKINAGATALETTGASSIGEGSVSLDPKAISIRPFIGISAEIDLWLGLREKR